MKLEEIEEEIRIFMSPRFYLKAPVELQAEMRELPSITLDVGKEKIKKEDEIKEISFKNGRSKRKLF